MGIVVGKEKNHYETLSVARGAPPEVIRAAYRALSQKWHPDKNEDPEAGRIMQAINAAYVILSDSAKRSNYDRTLEEQEATRTAHAPKPSTEQSPSRHAERRQAFEVDWDTVARAQTAQQNKFRVFGRDNLFAAARTFGLLLGAIFLLQILTSHG